jgi:hypothetical protein
MPMKTRAELATQMQLGVQLTTTVLQTTTRTEASASNVPLGVRRATTLTLALLATLL